MKVRNIVEQELFLSILDFKVLENVILLFSDHVFIYYVLEYVTIDMISMIHN